MVAGQDVYPKPLLLRGAELCGQGRVAQERAVEGEVARQQQRLRLLRDGLREKSVDDLLAAAHELAVGAFGEGGEVGAVIGEARRDKVRVRRSEQRELLLRAGCARERRTKQEQRQAAGQQLFHFPHLFLYIKRSCINLQSGKLSVIMQNHSKYRRPAHASHRPFQDHHPPPQSGL